MLGNSATFFPKRI